MSKSNWYFVLGVLCWLLSWPMIVWCHWIAPLFYLAALFLTWSSLWLHHTKPRAQQGSKP